MDEKQPEWPDYSQSIPEFLKEAIALGVLAVVKVVNVVLTQETKDKI